MNRDTIEPVTWERDRIDVPEDSGPSSRHRLMHLNRETMGAGVRGEQPGPKWSLVDHPLGTGSAKWTGVAVIALGPWFSTFPML